MLKEWIKKRKVLYNLILVLRHQINRLFRPKAVYLFLNGKKPLSPVYGLDRGQPIDRYYIEEFLAAKADLMKGKVLEIMENRYTKAFGQKKVTTSDVLDIDSNNPRANIIGDLKRLEQIPDDQYDCIILTQVLQFIDEPAQAIVQCYRLLKPGGTILATLPTLSRIDCVAKQAGDYWRFTATSAAYLFQKSFSPEKTEVISKGNLLSGLNFLIGLAQEEMDRNKLAFQDKDFPCLICVKATK